MIAKRALLLVVLGTAQALCAQPSPAPQAALALPQIFAPGVISGPANDGSPTFSPDGNALLFTRSAARWSIILESHRDQGQWSEPQVAAFSGQWSDSSPAMSPDGKYAVFVSVRPVNSDGTSKSQGASATRMASHIWRVNRTESGWGEPTELTEAVNFCTSIFRPSVASDGSIYFTAAGQGKELRLFRALNQNGSYQRAEALPFSDGTLKDVDPEIAPDQTFLIFTRKLADAAHEKLFITRNQGGVWGPVAPLRYSGDDENGSSDDDDPRLGNDHRTLYFSSDRSAAVHFPRTREQTAQDFSRLQSWDNGNLNIWFISLDPDSRAKGSN